MKKIVIIVWICLILAAYTQAQCVSSEQAMELVRRTAAHELATASSQGKWAYTAQSSKDGSLRLERRIETRYGIISRLIMLNGKPLTPAEEIAERERIVAFVQDHAALEKSRIALARDGHRINTALDKLPNAVLFQCGEKMGNIQTVTFKPNPSYQPQGIDLEGRIVSTMSGMLTIDAAELRLLRGEGVLDHDLLLAYGILGRLKQGSRVSIERERVGPSAWEASRFAVDTHGKLFIMFTVSQNTEELRSAYKPVPADLKPEQAVQILYDGKL